MHPSNAAFPRPCALPYVPSHQWARAQAVYQPGLRGAAHGWGVHGTAGGGGVQDGAGLTRALQLMRGEARRGGPTKTEVRQGEVTVCTQPSQLWGQGQRWGRGHGPGREAASRGLALGEESGRLPPGRALHSRPQPAEECGAGGGDGGGRGSVGDLGVGRQSALAAPVGLPEAPLQLL